MSRRSYDTDEITLRTVYARSLSNTAIPGFRVLTSDGTGSTYWAIPSTLGYNPSFNQIITDAATFTADLSYNRLRLNQGTGIGFSEGGLSNQLYIYAKAFGQIDVSGNNSIPAFTNNVLNPNLKFAGTGGLTIRSDSTTNTILFDAHGIPISSSLYSFQQIKALSNTSTVNYNISSLNTYTILNASSYSSIMTLVGLGLVNLTTDTMNNAVYIGLSNASTVSTSAIITSSIAATLLDSPFINGVFMSTATVNTSSIQMVDTQTAVKQLLSVKNSILQLNGAPITGGGGVTQITAGAGISLSPAGGTGIVQITATNTGTVTSDNLVSTVTGLGTIGYLSSTKQNSFSTGVLYTSSINFIDGCNHFIYPMTVSSGSLLFNGLNFSGGGGGGGVGQLLAGTNISLTPANGQGATVQINASVNISPNLTSTVIGLGTVGYVSTAALINHVSTANLVNLVSTANLVNLVSTANLVNFVSTANLVNLVSTANLVNLVSTTYLTSQLTSTVIGLGTVGYVSSASLTNLVSTTYLTSQLTSTVIGLGTVGYVSTAALINHVSTANLVNLVSTTYLTNQLTSTVTGLGTLGYLSSTKQYSFSTGILYTSSINFIDGCNNSLNYMTVSSGSLLFNGLNFSGGGGGGGGVVQILAGTGISVDNGGVGNVRVTNTLDLAPYATTLSLVSTVVGLGTIGYISTAQLTSTSKGLSDQIQAGSGGGITNANLVSTVVGLGTVGYVSTASLVNLVSTANLVNLVSTANLVNLVSTANLANLVSTANLINLVSTANLVDLISSPNLVNLVSTSYLLNGIEFSSLSNETARLNFSSLFVNNTPILFDQYGNLSLSFQTL